MPAGLLVLSNGHGEDLIALRVLRALREQRPDLQVAVLPLVGEGHAYRQAEADGWLERIGPRQVLPSGGFSNQSLRGLLRDLLAGLPLLSLRQWLLIRRWGRSRRPILAVGDLLPLLLAWTSGSRFAFIGTPKRDHTWATPHPAPSPLTRIADAYHRSKGSEWDPWEWALMGSRRCRFVAMRDALTAEGLQRHGVPAEAPGNPMMDGFRHAPLPAAFDGRRRLLLLAGSRLPESLHNLRRLLQSCCTLPPSPRLVLLLATGREPDAATVARLVEGLGFTPLAIQAGSGASQAWQRHGQWLLHGPGQFDTWAPWAELGLATAGTATEQLVGLGIPALSLPGPGPQFKAGFAWRQSRLLAGAVAPCSDTAALRARTLHLLSDAAACRQLGERGRQRMGPAGGSAALARRLNDTLLTPPAS
ncbi:MAG: lipid-A-disaccharide synthase-related protein [Cyanobacteriota bacterium]